MNLPSSAHEDRLREECGVMAVVGHPDAPRLCALGLAALQHRGQESAGIAAADGHVVVSHKAMGYVSEALRDEDVAKLKGHLAIGHVRYSTTGSSNLMNAQPIHVTYKRGSLAIAHNGNLVNATGLRRAMEEQGSIFNTTNDSEVILHLIARSQADTLQQACREALDKVEGAYSLLIIDPESVVVARDPRGFRPLCLGRLDGAWVAASETCALDMISASYEREVEPGEMVILDSRGGIQSLRFTEERPASMCIFEYVYFARPDSQIYGRSVNAVRRRMGEALGREAPAEADVVIGVPDSSNTASLGYSQVTKIPWELGLIRNHYVGRTFIRPSQEVRDFSVRKKYNPVSHVLQGQRVVVVDDSIVRGTTMRKLVTLIRGAGAREVHLRISSPPITHSCYYGIDTPVSKHLIASSHTVEEIAKYLQVDSLAYLSVEGLMSAVHSSEGFCRACFTGEYPVAPPESASKEVFEGSLSAGSPETD
ncbi:MAG TPA: amidophosphoribosyltransferase [Candidatus Krumholzibacteria bacterium]|nr:amidophosphoribosyltransferase [Candidatus Krumholzibacteria bacterium]